MRQSRRETVPVRFGVIATLSLLALLLSACGAMETDLTVYADERFAVTTTMTVPTEVLAMAGGGAAIKSQLDQMVAEAKAQGAQVTWRQGKAKQAGNTAYIIEMNGKGFQSKLIQDAFRLSWLDYQGRRAVRFEMSPGAFGSDMLLSAVTLHAGEVLSTNGRKVSSDAVRWDNPVGSMQAIVIPKGRTSALLILGIVLMLSILVAGGYFAYRRGYLRMGGGATAAPGSSGSFCLHCGQPIQAGARFCMSCGKELTLS